MKAAILKLLCMTFVLLLAACHSVDASLYPTLTSETPTPSEVIEYGFTIKGDSTDEFYFCFLENPIDAKINKMYESYDGSSRMIAEIAAVKRDLWRVELDDAYGRLLLLSDADEREMLTTAQAAWEEYMAYKKTTDDNFFRNVKYDTVGHERLGFLVDEEAEATKERAYVLLEYIYIITREIKMVYTPSE